MCSAENSTVVFVKFQLRDLKQNKLIFFKVRCAWVCGLFLKKILFSDTCPITGTKLYRKNFSEIFSVYIL